MYPDIQVKIVEDGTITIIQMNRQKVKNAVDTKTARLLYKYVKQFEKSNSKIAILYGLQDFCAGFDLKEAESHNLQSLAHLFTEWQNGENQRGPMGPTRIVTSKPIIAAVTGFCVAGGLQLALWCDMIVSHPQSVFGVFCRKVGVPLIDGGTVRLSQVVGLNRARDMILTGRQVSGQQAYGWGLVNRLVQKEDVLQQSVRLAKLISSHPQLTMLNDRKSLIQSTFGDIFSKLDRQLQLGIQSLVKGGSKQGVQTFNRRKNNAKL